VKPKRLLLLAAALAAAFLASCKPAPPPPEGETETLDLTRLNRTMAYAQLYRMLAGPEAFRGRKVRAAGTYDTAIPPGTTERLHACLVGDEAACCSLALEFAAPAGLAYPGDYPARGDPVTVEGVFETFEENGETFSRLRDAKLDFPRPGGK